MLPRLPRALAQVKTGNTSESLLNEIRQIKYLEKKILKKCIAIYWNQYNLKMDTTFINSENSNTSDRHD